ncbi:MAG TPA: hypothetical protein VL832_00700 [Puia sp.]|jgi:hypothetical protein|nr:hypothetical protein [Puia sp.]
MQKLFISPVGRFQEKDYFKGMEFSPGQPVLILDTTHKPAGSGIVQAYHPEAHQCTVLFQYPGCATAESISIPEYRLIAYPLAAVRP